MKKDKSLHPITPKIVDNIQQLNSSGLKKPEDKLFFDTVKQLITQFRRNFDVENKGGDQKKREDQFLDFTYKRISDQLSKVDTENIDYKSIIDRCFKDIDIQTESQQKIVETITSAIQEYFSKKTNKKSEKSSKEDVTKLDAELQNPDVDISIDEDELSKAFDDILKNNKKFDNVQKEYLKQNEQYNERIIQSFKQHLANYSQKLKEKNEVQNTQSNTAIKIQAPKEIEEIKKEEEKKKSPIQSLDKTIRNAIPTTFKRNRNNTSKDFYKQQRRQSNNIPTAFQNVQNIANNAVLGPKREIAETNATPKSISLKPKSGDFGYEIDNETQNSAGELVDRYYKNAKRSFIFLKMKQFFSWSSKMFGKILGPLRILAKPFLKLKNVMVGIGKKLGSAIKILITNSFSNLLKLLVMTPQGMYTLGFIIGFITEWTIQKFGLGKLLGRPENQNDPDSPLISFLKKIKWFFNFIVQPCFEIMKSLLGITWTIIKKICGFAYDYPKLTAFIVGLVTMLTKFGHIKTTINIAKMCGGGGLMALLGIGSAMATEAIMGGLFSSKSDEGSKLLIRGMSQSKNIGKFMNTLAIGNLSSSDVEKYNDMMEKMNGDYSDIQLMSTDLGTLKELKVDNAKGSYKNETIEENLGDDFLRRVFNSALFGFDSKGYSEFRNGQKGKTLDEQITELLKYLNSRVEKLNAVKITLEDASIQGRDTLSAIINKMYSSNGKDKTGKEQFEFDKSLFEDKDVLDKFSFMNSKSLKHRQSLSKAMMKHYDVKMKDGDAFGSNVINAIENDKEEGFWTKFLFSAGASGSGMYGSIGTMDNAQTIQQAHLMDEGISKQDSIKIEAKKDILKEKYDNLDMVEKSIFGAMSKEKMFEIIDGKDKTEIFQRIEEYIEEEKKNIEKKKQEDDEKERQEELKKLSEHDNDIKSYLTTIKNLEDSIEKIKEEKGLKDIK